MLVEYIDYRIVQQLRSKYELDFPEHPKPWHALWNEAIRERQNPHTKNKFLVYNNLKVSELNNLDVIYEVDSRDGIYILPLQVREISYVWRFTRWGETPANVDSLSMCGTDHYHPRYGWYFKKNSYTDGLFFKSKDGVIRWTKDNITNPHSRFYRNTKATRYVIRQQWFGAQGIIKRVPIYL